MLPTTTKGEVRGWNAIQDKFGRVISYEAKQQAPFHEDHYGNTVGDLDSLANFYLNPRTEAKYYPEVEEEAVIPIEDCNSDVHFPHLTEKEKKDFFSNDRRKCLNLKEKSVSGGTVTEEPQIITVLLLLQSTFEES